MARRHRFRRFRTLLIVLVFAAIGIGVYDWVFFGPIREAGPPPPPVAQAEPAPAPKPVESPPPAARAAALLAAETPASDVTPQPATSNPPVANPEPNPATGHAGGVLLSAGLGLLQHGQVLEAREKLSEALRLGLNTAETTDARTHLERLADQTIFGASVTSGDPHVGMYVIRSGETLAKIAKDHRVTADLLARINNIADKHRIREGQRLKVINGPFSAVVYSSSFDLEVYLDGTMVKRFRVGLGIEGSTPKGTWKVNNKLVNPTYFPPRGGAVIAADDPENPLGERWIGLTGIEGEAVGQPGYGIHGTIEPESIGQNTSLGCVRLLNADVESLFDLLVEEHSTVIIR